MNFQALKKQQNFPTFNSRIPLISTDATVCNQMKVQIYGTNLKTLKIVCTLNYYTLIHKHQHLTRKGQLALFFMCLMS